MSYVCGEPVVASVNANTFVTHIAGNSAFVSPQTASQASIAAVTSDRQIKVYTLNEQSPNGLTFISTIETGHKDTVTGIIYVSLTCIATCSEDGSVKVFDTASIHTGALITASITYTALKFTPLYSIAYSTARNTILAGGRDGNVYEWSCKTHRLLHHFDDFHSDDVGAVAYNQFNQMQRMTGSNDGTFCLFDTVDPDPTEWLQASVNHEVHIERFGLMSDDLLWVIDSNQQLEIYSLATSERMSKWLKSQPNPNASNPTDMREIMSKQCGLRIDNIIGCEFDARMNALRVLAGNNNGSLAMFRVDTDSISPIFAHSSADSTDYFQVEDKDVNVTIDADASEMETQSTEEPEEQKSDAMDADDEKMAVDAQEQPAPKPLIGHVEQIRDVAWWNSGSLMITVGNDGRICVWKQTASSPQNQSSGKQRPKPRSKAFSPY